jgi:hypothetical protein
MAMGKTDAERTMVHDAEDSSIGRGVRRIRGREVEVSFDELQIWGNVSQELVGGCISQIAKT